MQLFQPNNLSRRRPEFSPLKDPIIASQVTSLLAQHYGFPALPKIKISVFSGPNISAQNLKIETPAATAFLKSRQQSEEEKMRAEAELTFSLSEMGQKVPRIIRSRDGELVIGHEDKCWVLYEFQTGEYFSGKGNELQAAAETFGELSLAATQLFPRADTKPDALSHGLPELLSLANTTDLAELCAPHQALIHENLAMVEQNQTLLDHAVVPLHLDYHPLNLLMHEQRIACVVDLEHLKPYPVAAGLGFAGYKLIRQAMVDEDFRARELAKPTAVSTWLRGWQKSFPADRLTAVELGIGARSRILKLIHLILDAYLNHHNERHIYDLEKQITSLYEVDLVFCKA